MRITEDQIEQVRNANNILDVVGESVQLRKRGRNYIGLCPFHREKTPSFNVQEDKGIFKCFGCGKGGDVFRFVMELEKLTFPEAIERLAERANITLLTESTSEELQEQSERESIFAAAHSAYVWYFKTLRSEAGTAARKYVSERGLSQDTLKRFGVGFAPAEPEVSVHALEAEGISLLSLERAGIVVKGTGSVPYERFRGRLIFPILAPTGKVIGFGGRVIPGIDAIAPQAKYINSPETAIYHKSRVLYGLFQAKDAIRKAGKAYLVEGYADVLAVSQAGVENVVAASGTSLTSDQLDLLKRYTKSVVLLFDADQAGKSAAMRGIELALEAGFDVNTVILPVGEDPDSFLKHKGIEAFKDELKAEQSFIETKAQIFAEQGMLDDPTKQSQAVRSIVESIAKIPDRIKQELFIRKLATRFRILETTLLHELQTAFQRTSHSGARRHSENQERSSDLSVVENTSVIEPPEIHLPIPEAELVLLRAALLEPRLVKNALDRTNFDLALIIHPAINNLLGSICENVANGGMPDVGSLTTEYRDQESIQRILIDCAIENEVTGGQGTATRDAGDRATQMAEQAMIQILIADTTNKINQVRARLGGATEESDILALSTESLALAQKREQLKQSFSAYSEA